MAVIQSFNAKMHITPADPEAPAFRSMIESADAYMSALYPAESNHFEPPAALKKANVLFLGGYLEQVPVACGAVKVVRDQGEMYGELKRVFVEPTWRGHGFSKQIMQTLEMYLIEQRIQLARLETGIHQPEALGLYRRLGYQEIAAFGDYRPDPLSIFMEKRLIHHSNSA